MMIMLQSRSCYVTDCPICGRPVEIHSHYIGQEIACGHCRGKFVIYQTTAGLAARKNKGWDDLERAEQLLRHSLPPARPTSSEKCPSQRDLSAVPDEEWGPKGRCESQFESEIEEAEKQPTALLVEHRDEVFARIATDMAQLGMRVVRATSATDALRLCGTYEPVLVVAYVDLPEQSGWKLARKLRFVDQNAQIWLYQSDATCDDEGFAKYLQVDQLVQYNGDLLALAEMLIELMTNPRDPQEAAGTAGPTEQLSAA